MACLAGWVGCGESVDAPALAAVEVSWSMLPAGCEQAGVQEVRVIGSRDGETIHVGRSPCVDGTTNIEALTHGAYIWQVEGLNAQGVVVARTRDVEVALFPEQRLRLDTFYLTQTAPRLTIQWTWPDDQCPTPDAFGGHVYVFDLDGQAHVSRILRCRTRQLGNIALAPGQWDVLWIDAHDRRQQKRVMLSEQGITMARFNAADLPMNTP